MKALLIVAHGSRSEEANDEVRQLAERISERAGRAFDRVTHAFLEIADPRVDIAITELARAGAAEIRLFPYFLAAGTHVGKDIPSLIGVAKRAYPEITFEILPYLGALEGISALILRNITEGYPQL